MVENSSVHYRIQVTGKVQGVWYRKNTVEQALRLGLTGTVTNLPDGSVLIHAVGERSAMEAFLDWCAKGPAQARVDGMAVEDLPVRAYPGFTIL